MPQLLKEADRMAKRENRTRSELVREALRRYMAEEMWQEISQYGRKKAKKLGIKSENDVIRLIEEHRKEKNPKK